MPPLLAQLYLAILFMAGLFCLAHFIFAFKGSRKVEPPREVSGWQLSLVDFFLGLGAIILAILSVQVLLSALFPPQPELEGRASHIIIFGFATHLTALGALLLFFKTQRSKFAQPFNSRDLGWGESAGIALYAFLALIPLLYTLTFGWQYLLETLGVELDPQETVMIFAQIESLPLLILMFVLTILLAPISEEILFRGCLYRFLKAKVSVAAALIVSGVLFALLHANLLAFLPLFLLGVILAYAYETSGSIKVPILLHGIFNLNTVMLIVLTGNGA